MSQSLFRTNGRFAVFRHWFPIVLGACVSLLALAAHAYLSPTETSVGPLAILNNLFGLVFALSFSAILLIIGRAIASLFSLNFFTVWEELSISFFLGTGALGLSVLFLGLLGLLRPLPLIALLALCLALSASNIRTVYSALRTGILAAFTCDLRSIAFLFLALIALLGLRAGTPPHAFDELIYHLPVPEQFVQHGRVFASYDNSLGNVPFLIHMIYAICLMAGSDLAAKFFSLFVAVATALSIYAFCSRFLTRRVGIVALFAFFAAGIVVELSVTTRIDVSLAGMLFASTYSMINYLTSKRMGWLAASATLAGYSLGIKHTASIWLLAIGVLYCVEMLKSRESISRTFVLGFGYSLLALAIASPWYIKNYVWFHNPVYPFVTGEVADYGANGIRYFNAEDELRLDKHFELARAAIPDLVNVQEIELKAAAAARPSRHPMRLWEFFTKPDLYLMAEPYQFPNYLFLTIPLLVFLKKPKWINWLLSMSLLFVFSVTMYSWIARYLVPAYPALTIVAAYTITGLSIELESYSRLAKKLPLYAIGVALAVVVATCIASLRYLNSYQVLTGQLSRKDYMASMPDYRPIEFINDHLPQNAKVMLIGAQVNYGLKREYLSDESWFATKWRRLLVHEESLEGVDTALKSQEFTHILFNPTLFRFAAMMGVEGTGGMNLLDHSEQKPGQQTRSPEYVLLRNWSTFTLFQRQFLQPLYKDENGYVLYQIK